MTPFVLCSECFEDQGLKLDAQNFGSDDASTCPNCGATSGKKLTQKAVGALAHRFFTWGTLLRLEYGAAPRIVGNNLRESSEIDTSPWFEADLRLIEKTTGIHYFYYGPRTWMVGEVTPLKELQEPNTRSGVVQRIINEYPTRILEADEIFYRLRKGPKTPADFGEYDSPPMGIVGDGRFDFTDFPVMYGSQDLPVCIHECRAAAEDEIYVGTLVPTKSLKLVDLTAVLDEGEGMTEFESLDMAVYMLFFAGKHSYEIARAIAIAAKAADFDGLIYPSYFSSLRTGAMPFETTFGISLRRVRRLADYEKSKIIENLALFGRPIEQGHVKVKCIDKVIINRVDYGFHFGPVYQRNTAQADD
jgi:hypothetical protein